MVGTRPGAFSATTGGTRGATGLGLAIVFKGLNGRLLCDVCVVRKANGGNCEVEGVRRNLLDVRGVNTAAQSVYLSASSDVFNVESTA